MTVVQWTPGISGEVSKREDNIRRWLQRHSGETELDIDETQFFGELVRLYGRPFHYEGRTRKPLSSEDAEAISVATSRGWVLVTDDTSMKAVCDILETIWLGTETFLSQLEQFGF